MTVSIRCGIGEELIGRQIGQHLAFRQRNDAVGIGCDQVHIVLDQHDPLHAGQLGRRDQGLHDAVLVGSGNA